MSFPPTNHLHLSLCQCLCHAHINLLTHQDYLLPIHTYYLYISLHTLSMYLYNLTSPHYLCIFHTHTHTLSICISINVSLSLFTIDAYIHPHIGTYIRSLSLSIFMQVSITHILQLSHLYPAMVRFSLSLSLSLSLPFSLCDAHLCILCFSFYLSVRYMPILSIHVFPYQRHISIPLQVRYTTFLRMSTYRYFFSMFMSPFLCSILVPSDFTFTTLHLVIIELYYPIGLSIFYLLGLHLANAHKILPYTLGHTGTFVLSIV